MSDKTLGKVIGKYKVTKKICTHNPKIPVYEVLHTEEQKKYSMKKITVSQKAPTITVHNLDEQESHSEEMTFLQSELKILKRLQKAQFMKCHCILKTKNNIYAIFDEFPEITLRHVLNFMKGTNQDQEIGKSLRTWFGNASSHYSIEISDSQKFSIIRQIGILVEQMHFENICHSNICPQNVRISSNPNDIDDQRLKVMLVGLINGQILDSVSSRDRKKYLKKDYEAFAVLMQGVDFSFAQKRALEGKQWVQVREQFQNILTKIKVNDFVSIEWINDELELLQQNVHSLNSEDGQESPYFSKDICRGSKPESQLNFQRTTTANSASSSCSQRSGSSLKKFIEKIPTVQVDSPCKIKQCSSNIQQPSNEELLYSFDIKSFQSRKSLQHEFHENEAKSADHGQKILKIVLKATIFAMASQQQAFSSLLLRLVKKMFKEFSTLIEDEQLTDKHSRTLQKIAKSLHNLEKVSPGIVQESEVSMESSGMKQRELDGMKTLKATFIRKMIAKFNKYKDKDILINSCILIRVLDLLSDLCPNTMLLEAHEVKKLIEEKAHIDQSSTALLLSQLKEKIKKFSQY